MPELTPEHAEYLASHAVDLDLARELGISSASSVEDLPDRWCAGIGRHLPGIVFPWVSRDGREHVQLRPDEPATDRRTGEAIKYVFQRDVAPLLWQVRANPKATRVLIVEGSKQCLVAARYAPNDFEVYGVAGCWGWSHDGVPITDLEVVDGRNVVVIFDADAATNYDVYSAGARLTEALNAEGATGVSWVRLPAGAKAGLDDLLAARKPERRAGVLERLIGGAKSKIADSKPKPKDKRKAGPPDGQTEVIPEPGDPMAVARVIELEFTRDDIHILRHWRGGWMQWDGTRWVEVEDRSISSRLYERTENAVYVVETPAGPVQEKWSPTKIKIANLSDALSAITLLDRRVSPPVWLSEVEDHGTIVACSNGLLELGSRRLLDHDPRYFNLVSVPFGYDPDAPEPAEWLTFLDTLWPNGGDGQVDALQEWFGYVISGRLDYQKMFAIVGPPRSGKGTITRTLKELVGADNMAGPTLASLGTNFGLSTLLGKSLAVISDARLGGQTNRDLVVERLLTISGEDTVDVDRKHREHWVGKIPVRVMILSNELPKFADASGTIATRFIAVEHTTSFLGREDRGLQNRIYTELPGILNWALAGLDRLDAQGRFTEPGVSAGLVEIMRQSASPYAAFVADDCVVGGAYEVEVDRIWQAWGLWCLRNGREKQGTKQWFGRDLKSVAPGIHVVQPRDADGRQYRAYRGIGLRGDYPNAEGPGDGESDTRISGSDTRIDTRILGSDTRISTTSPQLDGLTRTDTHKISKVSRTREEDTDQDQQEEVYASKSGNGKMRVSARVSACHPRSEQGKGDGLARVSTRVSEDLVRVNPLVFDLETADAEQLYSYGSGFARLAGYTTNGQIELTTDIDRVAELVFGAGRVVGHNVMGFDLQALARYHRLDLQALARRGAVFDTLLAARHVDPPMAREKGRDFERYYDLDRLGEKYGFGGKVGDFKKLVKEFGGADRIPVDDPRYLDYCCGDVELSAKLYDRLHAEVGDSEYLAREHRVAAVAAQISLNGFRVDIGLLERRIAEGEERKTEALAYLAEHHGVPLADDKGRPYAAPLATKAGKAALVEALASLGITSYWTTGKTGDIATSYEAMKHLGLQYHHLPEVRRIAKAVISVVTTRTVYTTIRDNLVGDRVHPTVTMRQSTGRWSLTNPGLTVMGKRGGRHREREVFIPDPSEVIIAVDLSQVDMRAVAALSGDQTYIEMLRSEDPHAEIAKTLFGDERRREEAKAIGHGWNYGRGIRAIADDNDLPPATVRDFDRSMRERFPRLVQWQEEVRSIADSGELLDNGFGRPMRPDPMRAHTQGPALMGQGGARDLMMEGLLRLPTEILPMLRAQVHDEIVLSVPEADAVDVQRTVVDALSFEWRGVPIRADEPERWGQSWGQIYEKEDR